MSLLRYRCEGFSWLWLGTAAVATARGKESPWFPGVPSAVLEPPELPPTAERPPMPEEGDWRGTCLGHISPGGGAAMAAAPKGSAAAMPGRVTSTNVVVITLPGCVGAVTVAPIAAAAPLAACLPPPLLPKVSCGGALWPSSLTRLLRQDGTPLPHAAEPSLPQDAGGVAWATLAPQGLLGPGSLKPVKGHRLRLPSL